MDPGRWAATFMHLDREPRPGLSTVGARVLTSATKRDFTAATERALCHQVGVFAPDDRSAVQALSQGTGGSRQMDQSTNTRGKQI